MNSKQIGNITELRIMLSFIELGYNVLTPYGDCERYDFVVDAKNKFYKIQCKTARTKNNGKSFSFSGRSCNRKDGKIVNKHYNNKEIDYFATFFNGKCYLVPVDECETDKTLRIYSAENKQKNRISWAKDYELEEVVKKW